MTPRSNPLVDLVLVLVTVVAVGAAWCNRPANGEPSQPAHAVIRGDSPHVSLKAETYTPRVNEWVLLTGKFQGQLGAGNTACLTAWWGVDAQGVWKRGERWCGPPYQSFRRQYQFINPGEYTVTVTLRSDSGRELYRAQVVLGVQTMAQQDGSE